MKHQSFKVPSLPWNNTKYNHKKESFRDIRDELKTYPIDVIRKFIELFPIPLKNQKHYVCVSAPTSHITLKGRTVGPSTQVAAKQLATTTQPTAGKTTMLQAILGYFTCKVYFKDKIDFWYRWNRFKQLMVFW